MWSAAALLLALLAVVTAVAKFPDGLSVLACLVLAVAAASYGVLRRGAARTIGIAVALLSVGGALALVLIQGQVLVIATVGGALIAGRLAFRVHVDLPRAPRPQHPVLFFNPRSGGGKAARFHVAREARRRGIEPIELRQGDDLEELVRDAVFDGADALAMAGGDGSQAIVAMVAAELGLPYACIPAGTRNHFALDLGVDRDDVVGALDAFVDGGERQVDLAEVNDRVFVNNVSLGLYADAVQRPGYREAKLQTLLDTVPDVLGPDAKPSNLSWAAGTANESAVAILVSNNQYRLGLTLGSGTRPRLDHGTLGITVLAAMTSGGDDHRSPNWRCGSGPRRRSDRRRGPGAGRDRWRGGAVRAAAALQDPSAGAPGKGGAGPSRRLAVGARARQAAAGGSGFGAICAPRRADQPATAP